MTVDRLVSSPVFILSPPRTGSTLLRRILGGNSCIHAPHELHLTYITVGASGLACRGMGMLGLTTRDLEHLLWDRVLHDELVRSGKRILVEKTPDNVLSWRRIAACWPQARYIFLIRHPAHIAVSLASLHDTIRARGRRIETDPLDKVVEFAHAVDEARAELPGPTIRYEDLTTYPAEVISGLCAFLGVPWEPDMLDYGRVNPDRRRTLGDPSTTLESGRIHPPRPMPAMEDIPKSLIGCCQSWGYFDAPRLPASAEPPVAARPTPLLRTE